MPWKIVPAGVFVPLGQPRSSFIIVTIAACFTGCDTSNSRDSIQHIRVPHHIIIVTNAACFTGCDTSHSRDSIHNIGVPRHIIIWKSLQVSVKLHSRIIIETHLHEIVELWPLLFHCSYQRPIFSTLLPGRNLNDINSNDYYWLDFVASLIFRIFSIEFLFPQSLILGHLVFVLSVTLWQKKYNLGLNFCTLRDRDFIFGMYIQLMKPFQLTPRSMTSCPWPWPLTYSSKKL